MGFSIFIPDITKKNSSKDIIINILIKNYPLSLKKIYNKAKKDYNYSSSYQSIFKATSELLLKKVIIRKGNDYEINISWIKQLQDFTRIAETNYYAEKISEEKNKIKENIMVLNFERVFDAEKYLYYFVKNELKKMKNKKVIYETNNDWKVLFYQRAEYNYYKKLMKLGHKFFLFSSGKNKIEGSVNSYDFRLLSEDKKKILAPKAWFSAWSPEEEKYKFSLILDHSPNTTYSVVKQIVNRALLTDQESALVEIIKSMRYFRHVKIFKNDGEVKCSDLTEIITVDDMFKEKISRRGCQTMAPYVVQLANALNIPGETVRGYFFGVDEPIINI